MKAEITNQPVARDLRLRANTAMPTRIGSALLIVIGTLALISVFAAVYISIGRVDRRAANAVRVQADQQDTSFTFGEYFVTVIGGDRLDAYVQYGGAASGTAFGRREVTDAPYTDWTRRSESSSPDGFDLFTPIGGPNAIGTIGALTDNRVASDPWLASTTPVYLGNPGFENVDRPFSNLQAFDPMIPNAKNFMDNRDWLQISNFAPDGRFVNLFNLRPNRAFNDSSTIVGRFDAEPGTGITSRDDGRQIRRMSENLSLWNQETPGDPESMIQAFDPTIDGIWIPGENMPFTGAFTTPSDIPNTPAVWTMYQRFMFMPMNQPFVTLNRDGDISSWADPDYPPYQYADADGDGMADSRWFELVAARDKSEGDGTDEREDVEVLYNSKDYRYFVAARAVDLSSMANVNSATDLLRPPTKDYPLGLTPADIDLRRLLTMQDPAGDFSAGVTIAPLSYQNLHRPYIGNDEPIYGSPDPLKNYSRNVADYWYYQHGAIGSDLRNPASNSSSMLIGRYAYDALRRGIRFGGSLDSDYKGVEIPANPTPIDLAQFEVNPETFIEQITAKQRVDQYMNVGSLDPTNLGTSWSRTLDFKTGEVATPPVFYGSGLYGMDDLAELLTFHGLNDPEVTSRLEQVTNGRYEGPSGDEHLFRRVGPLMSNRPLSLDRYQHGLALTDLSTNPNQPPHQDSWNLREVSNGRVSINSMAHFALTPRNKLTTISGGVPLVPSILVDDPSSPTALTQFSAPPLLRDVLSSPTGLFGLYSSALAGEMDTPDGFIANNLYWPTTVADFNSHIASTLFYGHRGPEMALRMTAHAAVNMKDLIDADTDPTIATLIVDNQQGDILRTYIQNAPFDPNDDEYQLYPGLADGNVLDPGVATLLSGNLPTKRQAVNVFGFEAMPVITEVSVLYAFTDASDKVAAPSMPGDEDYNLDDEALFIPGGDYTHPDTVKQVSIDGEMSASNSDYLIEVLAFQLHNPYDHPISLGGNGLGHDAPLTRHRFADNEDVIDQSANYQFDYYIEFAGRFYKLANYLEWYPTENNAESYFSIDDSSTDAAFGTVDNPSDSIIRLTGGKMEPGTDNSNGSSTTAPGNYTNQAAFSDFITRNVVLGPQQTRVFYVIPDKRFDDNGSVTGPDTQWKQKLEAWGDLPRNFTLNAGNDPDGDGHADGPGDTRGWTGPAEQWVDHQFSVAAGDVAADRYFRPVMMMEFDPRDGKLLNESGPFEDPVLGSPTRLFTNRNDLNEVRLWKKIVTNNEESTDTTVPSSDRTERNLMSNDMLVDRMEVSFSGTHILSSGDTDIVDTVSYVEGYPLSGTLADLRGVRNDNTGITVAEWETFRRLDSPTTEEPAKGEVTPWMLRRLGSSVNRRQTHEDNLTLPELTTSDLFDGLDVTDTTENLTMKGDFEFQPTLRAFWDLSREVGTNAIVQTVALAPNLKSDPVGATNDPGDNTNGENGTLGKFGPLELNVSGSAFSIANKPAPLIYVGGDHLSSVPRLADLLHTWGIGTTYAPDPARTNDPLLPEYVESEWMTAPEAMAIALGIDNDPDMGGTDIEGVSIWKDAYNLTTNELLLDDGHLAIDSFVSFLNLNTEAPGTQPLFDPGLDIPRGTGVPMALGVIDHARAIQPIEQITEPDSMGATQDEQLQLALTRSTFGTININTAPVEVLRLLPGLTPSRASYTGGVTSSEWWGTEFGDLNLPDLNSTIFSENPDVASAIVAYRDRTYGAPNTAARDGVGSGPSFYDNRPLNFELSDPSLMSQNMRGEFPLGIPFPPDNGADRGTMTGIQGLRATPGFGSLGELLAVRINPEFELLDSDRWAILNNLSIQQYGNDDEAAGIQDPGGEAVTIMSQLFGGDDPGSTIDDYAERISMANGVLNTISVRSDYYAVWFVVHGYRESDVANLRPEDPLIPSVKKRFLMVVDRSNVIEPSDQPEILIFKELPL